MSDLEPRQQTVYVEVRRETTVKRALIGALLILMFIASIGVWGPYWVIDAGEWVTKEIVVPLSDWISRQFDKADSVPADPSVTTVPTTSP